MHRSFFSKRKRMKAIEELVRINFEKDPTPIICIKDAKIKPLSEGVAIYARVANDGNNDLTKQICNLREQAAGVGDVNFTEYSEVASGISKNESKRKSLYKLLSDAENGLIKRLYVKNRDRFSRDFVFNSEVINRLNKSGVEIIETF